MNRKEIRVKIQNTGIVACVRVPSAEDARFAAETLSQAGIPIVEIAMTIPGALQVISDLAAVAPGAVIGAGSVLDAETARRCLDAGASFLTTDGLIPEIVDFANRKDVVVFPGALTPTEVIAAWRAGSDFVKVVPVAAVGGENYVKALQTPLSHIPLIAAGGVNQQNAGGYLSAGATALGVGQALLPWEAVALRQSNRIRELARRFVNILAAARKDSAGKIAGPEWTVQATKPQFALVAE
ncbi:MAG TPA: bifunctional 4-hydroxy-2-oxoglutarate aldolase/2-dehydro-3-deoxy-phosphogluconate aldolase [Candidatus Sulfotelmatobacter sp.]|jgi:2-dehydro-3-deoxyphosphogluconate aldolase/(4S)-4-hydroxy-2-oxoglutarate aldolase|nr:bifunctional 4-hydroxy-2-oxoglutarate aldolase/2-dehydro-3-deoxy-phosphogluconate aldolase [Candidatus Sulfotelmatobacter sp.]